MMFLFSRSATVAITAAREVSRARKKMTSLSEISPCGKLRAARNTASCDE